MRYVVVGAGAIGGVVGARLHQAGHEVVLVARGGHLRAIRDRGLIVQSPGATDALNIDTASRPSHIEWRDGDVVMMAVKSHQSGAALADLIASAPVVTPIICLQNGIANEPAALRFFANVYGVSVACPTSHLEPGVVRAWSTPVTGLLDIGRYPSGYDELAEAVAGDLSSATFSSKAIGDIRRWKHRKLLTNLGNAIEAICGPPARQGSLAEVVTREGKAVLDTAGLEYATADEDRVRRGDFLRLGRIKGESRPGGSSWQSLKRATGDIETDYLNGEIVLLGRLHGVATPANELLTGLARHMASGRRSPGTIPEAELLGRLGVG
ncbi:MAG: ketopantoate reductase family protein [Acidimicrobiales bacterium]